MLGKRISFMLIAFSSVSALEVLPKFDQSSSARRGDNRIVGGEDASIEDFPFVVSLHFFHGHLCGASIISARWLLTAAHCTTLDYGFIHTPIMALSVRIGSHTLQSGGEQISVLRVYDHPLYLLSEPSGYDYDISLLYLEKDLTFSTTVQPIRLPETTEVYPEGTITTVAGWGLTLEYGIYLASRLQKVDVPIVSNAQCDTNYTILGLSGYITDRMLCAGYPEGGKDACGGDSGGPLLVNNTLLGIVSWGYGCARANIPGVYTSVQSLREWIRGITGL